MNLRFDFIDETWRGLKVKICEPKAQLWCIFLCDLQRAQENKKSLWERICAMTLFHSDKNIILTKH